MIQAAILWVHSLFTGKEKCESMNMQSCVYLPRFEAIEKELGRVVEQVSEVRSEIRKLTNRS
jgi:hypothetical protein